MNTRRPRRFAVLCAAFVLACFVGGWQAQLLAHPTAASFVVIEMPDAGHLTVTVTTPADAVRMKLAALGTTLQEQLDLLVDDARVPLTFVRSGRVAARPEQLETVFSVDLPANARTLRWRTSLFFGSYPLAVRRGGAARADAGDDQYEWLAGAELSQSYDLSTLAAPRQRGWARTARLISLGFTHIVPGGIDHMLFVLGLFLLAGNRQTLLLQISAFTVAHSLTLALAVLGWVAIPSQIVEPLIAVSIAYVAIENLAATSLSRWRLLVVFLFGLLHGLGFAGALGSLGLSDAGVATTLVGFNLGVELGQLAVVVAAALVVRALPLAPGAYRRLVARPVSAAIAAVGVLWAIERVI